MKNSNFPLYLLSIVVLVLLQLFIFNNLIVFNGIFPIIYIIFIIYFDTQNALKINFLFYAFLIGFIIDLYSNSIGINSFTTVFAAFIRKYILRFIKNDYFTDSSTFKFSSLNFVEFTSYVFIVTLFHHTTLYLVEGFKFSTFFSSITKAFNNSILTSFFIIIFSLFKKD